MTKEEQALDWLEKSVDKYKIFIDTCSLLMGDAAHKFLDHIVLLLDEKQAKLYLPQKCLLELNKHADNQSDVELSKKAREILSKLKQYENYISVKGDRIEGESTFADKIFLSMFPLLRDRYDLLLITQDNNLAKEIFQLNESKAVKSTKVVDVKQINRYGFLSPFDWQRPKPIGESAAPKSAQEVAIKAAPTCSSANKIDAFRMGTKVTEVEDAEIKIPHQPQVGDWVYTDDGQVKLTGLISDKGGEGIVYETDTTYVAKIYKPGKLTRRRYEKIVKIIDKGLSCNGICFPTKIIYTNKREFIGYLMPRAKGEELGRSIFIKKLFTKKFPSWRKEDLVQLCITILKKIKYLHEHNVIIGDVNAQNILVVSPSEVYFVDTDSYQIENYPCPVGFTLFTAPEIQGKKYSDFLRSTGNENFSIATLMFMIMLPGKQPYAQQGGEDQATNIKKMDFPYPCGEKSNKKTPEGPWGYIWSHLPRKIKEAFYATFMKGESHATEQTRLNVDDWLKIFNSYYYELTDPNGNMLKNDSMSGDLFPTRYKKQMDHDYIVCALCHQEVDSKFAKEGICQTCLHQSAGQCSKCGKDLPYNNFHKYIQKKDPPKLCKECYDASRVTCVLCGKAVDINSSEGGYCNWCLNTYDFYPCNKCGKKVIKITNRERYINKVSVSQTCDKCKPYTQIVCSSCGQKFTITVGEKEFFDHKGFELPKKCKKCKEEKSNNAKSSDGFWNTTNKYSNNNSRLQQEKETAKNEVISLCDRAKYTLNFLQISKKNNITSFCSRITRKIDWCNSIKEVKECAYEAKQYINNKEYSWH